MFESRERWTTRAAFVVAAIGSAIGLGNVWRFPAQVYQYGGGAFLVPYFIALFTAGIPLLILEFGLGHLMQSSAPESFRKARHGWEWLGWWALGVGLMISFYYAVIMSWSLKYLWHALQALFTKELPWKGWEKKFLEEAVLQVSKSPFRLGGVVFPIVIGLALTWGCVWWIIVRGVKRVGRVVMLTVPLPTILIAILFLRGVTLPGAVNGLNYYLQPRWSELLKPQVWLAAYGQIFFTLTIAFGVMIAYASYLPKRSDITNNAFITSLANCGYSFFAGFAVFSTLGFLALQNSERLQDVVRSGITLAFVTYPTAIGKMPGGVITQAVLAIIFFITLFTLGIDSLFSIVEAVVTGFRDKFKIKREKVVTFLCIISFIFGLLYCTKAGLLWLDIVDHWMSAFGLACVGLFQCILIGWLFGTPKIREHINQVSDFKIGKWWDFCIKFLTPLILIITIGMSIKEEFSKLYGGYPLSAIIIGGWSMAVLVVVAGIILGKVKRAKTT